MEKKYTIKEVEEQILSYMKEKYDEDFKVDSIGKPLFTGSSVEASLYLEDDEYKNIINMYWEFKEDGSILIREDYTELLFKDEIIKYMDKKTQKAFGEFTYQTYSNLLHPLEIKIYDSSIPFGDYIKDGKISIETTVILDESALNKEREVEQGILNLYEILRKDGMKNEQFYITVYILKNEIYTEKSTYINNFKNSGIPIENTSIYPIKEYLIVYDFTTSGEEAEIDKNDNR